MYKVVKSFKKYHKALKYIAERLSIENLEELKIINPEIDPCKAILACAEKSEKGFILFDFDGNPRAAGGIFSDRCMWFVVTKDLSRKEYIPWIKHAKDWLSEIMKDYPTVWGHEWAKNTRAMMWLRWIGFDFAFEVSKANIEINGEKFIYFQKNR